MLNLAHKQNINNIGVFKAIANDTSLDKMIYVLIPFKSLKEWQKFRQSLRLMHAGKDSTNYVDAAFDKPAFKRMETILLSAFKYSAQTIAPKLNSPRPERVYELRSYESSTEKLHENKVKMFNEGGEVDLFAKLNFNAVFYGQVIFGAKMPNLMYMTAFESMEERGKQWKRFGSDSTWQEISALREYQHNVSKNEIVFLRATVYSDL